MLQLIADNLVSEHLDANASHDELVVIDSVADDVAEVDVVRTDAIVFVGASCFERYDLTAPFVEVQAPAVRESNEDCCPTNRHELPGTRQ